MQREGAPDCLPGDGTSLPRRERRSHARAPVPLPRRELRRQARAGGAARPQAGKRGRRRRRKRRRKEPRCPGSAAPARLPAAGLALPRGPAGGDWCRGAAPSCAAPALLPSRGTPAPAAAPRSPPATGEQPRVSPPQGWSRLGRIPKRTASAAKGWAAEVDQKSNRRGEAVLYSTERVRR